MSDAATAKKSDADKIKVNEAKWSKTLMDAGWTAFPSIVIEKQEALGLDALDMNIILHLSSYWWTAENLPHPSVETIAKALQVKPRTIQKRVKALHELGLIERQERRAHAARQPAEPLRFQGTDREGDALCRGKTPGDRRAEGNEGGAAAPQEAKAVRGEGQQGIGHGIAA